MATEQRLAELQALAEPFQFVDSDIILRTRGADFRVHKLILSHASTVFRDMFSLPRVSSTSQEGSHVVEVTEDPQTIHDILSLIYRNAHELDLDDFPTLQRVLLAARKYEMDNLQLILAKTLESKVPVNPVRIFAIACLAKAPHVARIAAKETLKWSYNEVVDCDGPEINRMRAGTLRKLFRYHNTCADLASQTIRQRIGRCPTEYHLSNHAKTISGGYVDCRESWWNTYIDRVEQQSKTRPLQPDYKTVEFMRGLSDGRPCGTCFPAAVILIQLAEQLKQEIQQAISNVRFISLRNTLVYLLMNIQVQLDLDDDDFLI